MPEFLSNNAVVRTSLSPRKNENNKPKNKIRTIRTIINITTRTKIPFPNEK